MLVHQNEEDYKEYEASLELMASTLACEVTALEEELEGKLPLKCSLRLKDTTVQEILSLKPE
jgi:hypothetical protein